MKKNKQKTFLIVSLFFLFITLFIYFLSVLIFDNVAFAVIIGLTVSILISYNTYYYSDQIVLKLNKARVATKEEFAQLNHILEGLCIAANVPVPKLYVMDDSALNAFATGRNPENAVICITTGLLERLDKNELEGVIAHELSHIRNYDILLQTIVIVMVGFVVIISDAVSRGMFRGSRDDDNKVSGIIAIIGIIFLILSPIFAELMKLAISRNREYLADASAIELTRNKDGLINALKKLTHDSEELEQANKSSSSLFIVNPLVKERKKKNSLWSTHPTLDNRIERLQNIN
ncbi:MAG: M48 family metallopeptidase [Bacilli bacterium]|nr:M48 family metallopeptidase [Bacilli bacterium]MDD4808761.1 M48 family metallopeptidase [Bacilli bacterium]